MLTMTAFWPQNATDLISGSVFFKNFLVGHAPRPPRICMLLYASFAYLHNILCEKCTFIYIHRANPSLTPHYNKKSSQHYCMYVCMYIVSCVHSDVISLLIIKDCNRHESICVHIRSQCKSLEVAKRLLRTKNWQIQTLVPIMKTNSIFFRTCPLPYDGDGEVSCEICCGMWL